MRCFILLDLYNYIVARCCNAHSDIILNGLSLAFAPCSVLSAQFLIYSQHWSTSGLVMDLGFSWYELIDLVVRSSISSQLTVYYFVLYLSLQSKQTVYWQALSSI